MEPNPHLPSVMKWLQYREWGRTDLLWLCHYVLDYRDIDADVHGPLIDGLQKFPGRKEGVDPVSLRLVYSEPRRPLWNLEGPRKRIFLFPRLHLKTTVITIAHSIQWIINYEDIRILLDTATATLAQKTLSEIRAHFQFNERFRFIYPEVCPKAKSTEFGNQEEFTVPSRRRRWIKEPTVMTSSVGKTITGLHVDVKKHNDLVTEENSHTQNQIAEVVRHFGFTNPLLERGGNPVRAGWVDVEGTRYDASDLYGVIIDDEEKRPADKKEWQVVVRSAEVDPKKKIALWPARYPWEELMKMKADPTVGPDMYSAQMLQEPVPAESALARREEVRFFPQEKVKELLPRYAIHTTIDLAGMDSQVHGDYTVLTTAGFDRDGRIDILEILHDHFTPHQVIELIFSIEYRWHPLDYKIEKDAHARVLLPFLQREMAKRSIYLSIFPIKRDNRVSKQQRIKGLQSWFKTGNIRFSDQITCKHDLILEILRFPRYRYDDILDTLADQLQNRDSDGAIGDVIPHMKPEPHQVPGWMRPQSFLGFDPWSHEPMFAFDRETEGVF